MKVIMIKKYLKYNVDEIVEVSDGFGTNFLIKNGYAVPVNKATNRELEIKKENKEHEMMKKRNEALELKEKLENLELVFYLKTTNDVVHGSITSKKVNQELIAKGFKLDKHVIPHISISSLGITKVKINLFKDVEAILKINVKGEHGK